MRILLGMVLGAALTVAAAYFYDLRATSTAANTPAASEQRPMVNWDVVETNWREFKARALQSWTKVAG